MDETKPKRKTHTSSQVKNKWKKENYARISLEIPKEDKEKWIAKATENGFTSLNAFIRDCVEKA